MISYELSLSWRTVTSRGGTVELAGGVGVAEAAIVACVCAGVGVDGEMKAAVVVVPAPVAEVAAVFGAFLGVVIACGVGA